MRSIINLFQSLIRKLVRVPEKKESSTQLLRVDTMCMVCLWEGNFTQTMTNDDSNDTCPRCGNSELTYLLD